MDFSIRRYGDARDGGSSSATESTTTLQALNHLFGIIAYQGGGTVHLTRGHLYRVASADLYLNVRVIVQGSGGVLSFASGGTETWLRGASGFVLDPRYSILLGQGGALRDVFVIRDGLPWRAPSVEAAITGIDRWLRWRGRNQGHEAEHSDRQCRQRRGHADIWLCR